MPLVRNVCQQKPPDRRNSWVFPEAQAQASDVAVQRQTADSRHAGTTITAHHTPDYAGRQTCEVFQPGTSKIPRRHSASACADLGCARMPGIYESISYTLWQSAMRNSAPGAVQRTGHTRLSKMPLVLSRGEVFAVEPPNLSPGRGEGWVVVRPSDSPSPGREIP